MVKHRTTSAAQARHAAPDCREDLARPGQPRPLKRSEETRNSVVRQFDHGPEPWFLSRFWNRPLLAMLANEQVSVFNNHALELLQFRMVTEMFPIRD